MIFILVSLFASTSLKRTHFPHTSGVLQARLARPRICLRGCYERVSSSSPLLLPTRGASLMRCALANLYPFSVPHLARGFQVCWRIVIAGHDDDRAAALSEKRGE